MPSTTGTHCDRFGHDHPGGRCEITTHKASATTCEICKVDAAGHPHHTVAPAPENFEPCVHGVNGGCKWDDMDCTGDEPPRPEAGNVVTEPMIKVLEAKLKKWDARRRRRRVDMTELCNNGEPGCYVIHDDPSSSHVYEPPPDGGSGARWTDHFVSVVWPPGFKEFIDAQYANPLFLKKPHTFTHVDGIELARQAWTEAANTERERCIGLTWDVRCRGEHCECSYAIRREIRYEE